MSPKCWIRSTEPVEVLVFFLGVAALLLVVSGCFASRGDGSQEATKSSGNLGGGMFKKYCCYGLRRVSGVSSSCLASLAYGAWFRYIPGTSGAFSLMEGIRHAFLQMLTTVSSVQGSARILQIAHEETWP